MALNFILLHFTNLDRMGETARGEAGLARGTRDQGKWDLWLLIKICKKELKII